MAYTVVSLIASSLSKSLTTTAYNMLFSSNYKTCVFVLANLFPFYDLQNPSVPESLCHGGADHC